MDDNDIQLMPRLPGLVGIEQHCWQQFLSCSTNLVATLDVCLRSAHGVTTADALLLEVLSRPNRRPNRMCDLAQGLRVSPHRLAHQVRRLEAGGLVTRDPSRGDPRGMLPRITAGGYVRLQAVLETYAKGVRAHCLDQLQHEQMISLVDSCRRINGSLAT